MSIPPVEPHERQALDEFHGMQADAAALADRLRASHPPIGASINTNTVTPIGS